MCDWGLNASVQNKHSITNRDKYIRNVFVHVCAPDVHLIRVKNTYIYMYMYINVRSGA